ncbi:MAG: response regulator [Deltaproteobacteria bacterium]|nr:response regulator [Deltaproteobacteria bacterium]
MPKSLLLADDSITIQKVVQITFASEDFQITSCDNGDAALDKIRAVKPHIVLADVVMPGKNGYDLCQTIKGDAGLKGTPVILLAGTFEPFDPERAKAVGADDYIVKPFETQALIDKVKRLVGMEAGAANTLPAGPPKQAQTGGFAPPANPLFGAKPAAPAITPMAAPLPPPQQQPPPAKPAASPFSGAGPLPAFGQGAKPPAPAQPPVPAKDPFGMGPMFGGNKPQTPVQPAAQAAATPPAAPAGAPQKQWDMNSFDEIPAAHPDGGMPDIDMVEVEPVETKPATPPPAKPMSPPPQTMPSMAPVAQAMAPKVAAAVTGSLEAQLKGPLTDAVREIVEKIVWEVVPDLAETIIREELERILREKA